MLWLKILVVVGTGLRASDLQEVHQQDLGFNCTPAWHFQFQIPNYTSPQLRAIHDGTKLTICYRDAEKSSTEYYYSCMDTENYFDFSNYRTTQLPKLSRMDWLFYDDNKVPPNSQLSVRSVYPAIIAVTDQDAYSSTDNDFNWVETCKDCINCNITKVNAEIFKSNDGTFWASFNDNNTIVTSRDVRNWAIHKHLYFPVQIHNSFPIKMQGTDMWVIIDVINNIYYNHRYYYGTMTYDNGYENESPAINFTYGDDDAELFIANRGDIVEDYQIAILVLKNYFTVPGTAFNGPVILATPRKVMFKDIGDGIQRLIQVPAIDISQIPTRDTYEFSNQPVSSGTLNPLDNLTATRFTITNMTFDLLNSSEVGIRIRMSADGKDFVQIGYWKYDVYYVDRTHSALPAGILVQNGSKYNRRLEARIGKTLDRAAIQFSIYADGCLLEVFAEYFRINFNLLIFSKTSSNRMELISSEKQSTLTYIQILAYD